MIAALDRLACWWLDRHCRRWMGDLNRSAVGPECIVRAYTRSRGPAAEATR